MKRVMLALVIASLLGAPLVMGRGQAPSSGDPAKKKPPAKQTNIEELMQRKQKLAHEVLDALIFKDYKRINKNAGSLVALSKAAEFQVHRTPLYAQAAGKLGQNARDKNSDGTTRAFSELVHCCIACHDYIRAKHGKD